MDFLRPEVFTSYAEVKNILSDVISEEKTPLQNAKLFLNTCTIISVIKKALPMWKLKQKKYGN